MEILSLVIGISYISFMSIYLPVIVFSICCAELSRAHSQR